ncbi:BatD family protein [Sinorhizobium arboris]|uniref:BatD family protein n=1 Tax=Sinorhizobium arboris TaxID=76745 RepID=UPI0004123852|nr:BatD family protein [Sinorhizobium arboris]
MTTPAFRPYRLLAALFCWLAAAGPAFSADPFARAALQSTGTLYVGQQILVDVDVLVPNYFLQPPQFPAIDLPGAIVTLDDGRALNLNETIDGTSYSGIRRTYMITPQSAGEFTLPPAVITFGYAAVPPQAARGQVTVPPLRFTIEAAPGSAGESPGVVAAKVGISQELDQEPAALKAGDTLVRTVSVRAEGLRAMMIPEPEFSAPRGVRLYRQDPVLSEETDRNGQAVAGLRKDVASYLFQDPGTYILPAVTLSWFDPASGTTQSATAPAVRVTVAAATTRSPAIAPPAHEPQPPPFDWLHPAVTGGGVLISALVLWAAANRLTRLQARWEERRSKERQSEPAFFRHVEQACRNGPDEAIARALDAWSRKAGVMPLESWLGRFADAGTQRIYQIRQRALYGPEEASSRSDAFLPGLKRARQLWLRQGAKAPGRREPALLPLNPTMR